MFVGEGPGEAEDLSGLPFVGRAGKLLEKMLSEIKLSREDVFITNVVKCRPPGNRDPKPEEIATCEPYLHRQIELIRPKVIIALGRIAGKLLIGEERSMKDMRGKLFNYRGVDLRVLYHPAAILRNMGLYDMYRQDFEALAGMYLKGRERGRDGMQAPQTGDNTGSEHGKQ